MYNFPVYLRTIQACLNTSLTIFHTYTSKPVRIRAIVDLQFFFSGNPAMRSGIVYFYLLKDLTD